jgi:hypothetical protein
LRVAIAIGTQKQMPYSKYSILKKARKTTT